MRVAPAHARLPAARPFGLEAGIAGEGAGEEAVEVVEGRLGDSFTISGVESKAFHRAHQNGGAEGGGVGEGAEGVMARGEVGDDPIGPLRAPLAPFAQGPAAHRRDPVLRLVERVGAGEEERIEAVIFAVAGDIMADEAEADAARGPRFDLEAGRQVVEPVPLPPGAERIDTVAAK